MSAHRTGTAFTLLEAMIALIVLAGVAAACLQLRAQALRARIAAAEATTREAALQGLLEQAIAGFLGEPSEYPADDAIVQRTVWTGALHGAPYEVVREVAEHSNPVRVETQGEDDDAAPELIWLAQWTVDWNGDTIEAWRIP